MPGAIFWMWVTAFFGGATAFIDTLVICTATAFMCLSTSIVPSADIKGAPYVQACMAESLGTFGPIILSAAILILHGTSVKCLNDYTKRRKNGEELKFYAKSINLKQKTDFWN